MRRVTLIFLPIFVLSACSTYNLGYDKSGKIKNSLTVNNKLCESNDTLITQQTIGLKNTVYNLFFTQGIFAGQDNNARSDFKYQRWQVPLVIGAMIDLNQNYLGQFHDFLPVLTADQQTYNSLLENIYQVNNWDTFSVTKQQQLCKQTQHCLYIDDRLWWVNVFLSYADGLTNLDNSNPQIDKMLNYAYKIYIDGISRDDYLNQIGTPGAVSLMWFSSNQRAAEYKSTISNSLYVTAGARLAKLIKYRYGTNNNQFNYNLVLNNAKIVADGYFLGYFNKLNMNGLLLDGITTGGSSLIHRESYGTVVNQMFTYNQGVVLPGMAILAQLTGDKKYMQFAKQLILSSYNYSNQYNGFFDDYGYLNPNGWFSDGDGIAFRLAYWQYFSLFLENYDLKSDAKFYNIILNFVTNNANQLIIRKLNTQGYPWSPNLTYLVSPNHNNYSALATGKLFTNFPDGYSTPGTATALELLILKQRISYLEKTN